MFYEDWKFWLFVFTLINTGLTAFGFLIVKYNDFKHLGKKVEEIDEEVKQVRLEVGECTKEIANLKGRLDAKT